jgi:polyhydroxyalkanoate synthesis regulator phasin
MATRSDGPRSRKSSSSSGRSQARRTGAARGAGAKRSAAPSRTDKSVEAFRQALERSVTLSRGRLEEAVDDAVKRGRMTRSDANELISNLVTRSRQYTDDLVRQLERLLEQAQRELARAGPARRRAGAAAGRAARVARDAADRPLARADRLRRRAGVRAGGPISAYDQLTASQIRARLRDLSPAELRQVRTRERRGKARKGVLDEIERRLRSSASG